jgi:hypothetical protein
LGPTPFSGQTTTPTAKTGKLLRAQTNRHWSHVQNLARRGKARQSTENAGNFPARLAIDGVPNNFSHTADGDPLPWWEVILAKDSSFRLIGLWNRKDCCATRLSNFRVSVLDADR